jgi:hypothetical protein
MFKINISFLCALFLTFLILKIIGIITWSWWWILSPIWVPIFLGILLIIGVLLILNKIF